MKYLILLILVSLVGCGEPNRPNPSKSPIELFKHEGCTVFRFADQDRYHYYTRCDEFVETITTQEESCGKGCVNKIEENIKVRM